MTPEQLMCVYPWMDFLVADTLIDCHQRGTLSSFLETAPPTEGMLWEDAAREAMEETVDEDDAMREDHAREMADHKGVCDCDTESEGQGTL